MLGFTCLFYFTATISYAQHIQLKNNGYKGVLIAISDNVPYDADLIPRIQEVFNEASSVLYVATKYRAYFKEISILVPSNWSVKATIATTETFDKANIRVDLPSCVKGDNPWVHQPAGCGEPGEFMHITPNFLLDEKASKIRWGPTERVIVHEWGHLRWGLFEEYPVGDRIDEHFYFSPTTNRSEASRCNLKVQGRRKNRKTGAPCSDDASPPDKDCRFYPFSSKGSGLSSMMSYQFLPEVTQFCDNDVLSPDTLHNIEAPNRQNRFCNMKSSWQVMRESPDFFEEVNPSKSDPKFNTTVSFKVIQRRPEEKIVIVMDVSSSMSSNDYIRKMEVAVKYYLSHGAFYNSWIGLVKYSTEAERITLALTQITGETTRAQLASMLQLSAGGMTAIGKGLQMALQILRENSFATGSNTRISGSRIILLTDGQQNTIPNVQDVIPEIVQAGVIVDAILLTSAADDVIRSLAQATGGIEMYSSGDEASSVLMEAYINAERLRSSNPLTTPITIMSRVLRLQPYQSYCFGVHVDKSLGVDTTLTFNWINDRNVHLTITSPNNMTKFADRTFGKSFAYKNNNSSEIGLWNVCLRNLDPVVFFVTARVESTAGRKSPCDMPITVRTTILNKDPSFASGKPVTIFATVTKGFTPVTAAKVTAHIEAPTGSFSFQIELRDDGNSADRERDDGIYSGYILNTGSIGKHAITITVIGTNDTQTGNVKGYSNAAVIGDPDDKVLEQIHTDEFERHSLAGFIDVHTVADAFVDNYPPSKIKDFDVIEKIYDTELITFAWTAVGDDYNIGNASSYELWQAEDFKAFLQLPFNASKIKDSEVIEGNLNQPLPPFSKEQLTIKARARERVLVYAIIAMDEYGNASPISNIVPVKLAMAVQPTEPTTGTSMEFSTGPPTEPSTEPPTATSTGSPTKAPTEPSTEPPTATSTGSPTKAPTEPSTEPPTEPSKRSPTKSSTKSLTEPSKGSPTKSSTKPLTEPSVQSSNDLVGGIPKKIQTEIKIGNEQPLGVGAIAGITVGALALGTLMITVLVFVVKPSICKTRINVV